jgi:Predicted membrane protein
MTTAFWVLGVVFAGLAALIHVYIFALESLLWSRPSTQRTFGVREARDADAVRPWAYNQGFYNLFLAVGAGIGLALLATASRADAGFAVVLFALASMLLAAFVLVTSNRRMLRAALVQGLAPALGILFLVVARFTG